MMNALRRAAVVALLILSACTQTTVSRLAVLDASGPPADEHLAIVPETGFYKVKAGPDRDRLSTLKGTGRMLREGDPVGFRRTDDGRLLAVAGEEVIPLDEPTGAQYLMWYRRTEVPSQAGQDVAAAAAGTAQVIVFGAALIGITVLKAALEDEDDCDDSWSCRHHHHRHHDHGRDKRSPPDKKPAGP